MVDSFRALGIKVPYQRSGPFFALRDGSAMPSGMGYPDDMKTHTILHDVLIFALKTCCNISSKVLDQVLAEPRGNRCWQIRIVPLASLHWPLCTFRRNARNDSEPSY